MAEFVKVAKVSEVDEDEAICVEVKDKKLAIFHHDGEFYCLDDTCSHADAPLSEGYLENGEIECPWHAARFDLKTGKALCEPAEEGVCAYSVRVSGDDLEVEV